jgi:hypothetical protein
MIAAPSITSPATPALSNAELIDRIKAHIRQGQQAKERADANIKKHNDHYIAAGRYLIELKQTLSPDWKSWESCLQYAVKISTGRASELMQLADGRKDLQQIRDATAERVRAHRAATSLHHDVTKNEPSEPPPAPIAQAIPPRAPLTNILTLSGIKKMRGPKRWPRR